MNASVTRLLLQLLVLGALAPAVAAQARLQVPGQFAQIGAAVQAASPGTIIEVQQGTYLPFVVDREVTIVGHAGEQMAPVVRVPTGGIASGDHDRCACRSRCARGRARATRGSLPG